METLKTGQAEGLEVAREKTPSTLAQLQDAVATDQQNLVANLKAQIVVLSAMKTSASGHEAALDKIIAALREERDAS